MKLSYPASRSSSTLNDTTLSLKIARHSPCSICEDCAGLKPPPGVQVTLDDAPPESSLGDLGQYGSDEEDSATEYLEICNCGHSKQAHGADELEIGREEFARRGRVAVRLDELLQVRIYISSFQNLSYARVEI